MFISSVILTGFNVELVVLSSWLMELPSPEDVRKAEPKHKPHGAPKESTDSIELRLDGEDRFRAAVRAAAKSGPMHRPAKR